jgi:hypothetical protein
MKRREKPALIDSLRPGTNQPKYSVERSRPWALPSHFPDVGIPAITVAIMSLTSLGEYLLFLVCLEPPLVGTITLLLQVGLTSLALYFASSYFFQQGSEVLCSSPRCKAVQMPVNPLTGASSFFPHYLKPYDSWGAVALEACLRIVIAHDLWAEIILICLHLHSA